MVALVLNLGPVLVEIEHASLWLTTLLSSEDCLIEARCRQVKQVRPLMLQAHDWDSLYPLHVLPVEIVSRVGLPQSWQVGNSYIVIVKAFNRILSV